MGGAVPLRADYDGPRLRRLARASDDANQTRRLLALAVIYDGGKRVDAAALGGVGLQIVRDWVLRFNAHGPAGLIDRKAPGQTPKLIPTCADHDRCAQLRSPMDMMVQGWSMSLFQA
jgi:transposase